MTGETIGRYELLDRIGRGSMGTVYRARDSGSGREVAVKVMSAELSGDPELSERFRREALAAADLDHPNIVDVYDFGEHEGRLFMAMELLQGNDLKDLIEQQSVGGLTWKLDVMVQVASGMAFVHARGLVHRDLKPGNIHIQPDGRPKIMDFGLVRISDSNMTRTGMVMGSPAYMAPEQLRGDKADSRADVFSLGAVFYELLCGQRAFAGKAFTQILMNVMTNVRTPLVDTAPDVPPPVIHIVERCLRASPGERYQTGGELHAAAEVALSAYGE
jgi:eukaryotic-like serine/threonine-protein kinase